MGQLMTIPLTAQQTQLSFKKTKTAEKLRTRECIKLSKSRKKNSYFGGCIIWYWNLVNMCSDQSRIAELVQVSTSCSHIPNNCIPITLQCRSCPVIMLHVLINKTIYSKKKFEKLNSYAPNQLLAQEMVPEFNGNLDLKLYVNR